MCLTTNDLFVFAIISLYNEKNLLTQGILNMSESGEQFLHKKDPRLYTTRPVEHEQINRKRAGREVSQRPADKIASWLGVIEKTHMGHKDDPRVLERIKGFYHREHVIKPEDIPQSYWNLQGEIAVNEGRKQDLINSGVLIEETKVSDPSGAETIKRTYIFPEEIKEQAEQVVVSNQQQSLDKWVNYLTSNDAPYPMWAKYWAFRSVVKMGKLEKTEDGRARFATREKNTVSSFPILNQRALANTFGAMSARLEAKGKPKDKQSVENLSTTLSDDEYQKLASTEDFSKLYAQFLAEIPEYSSQGLEETRGKWVKYSQNSDPKSLVSSLEGHPLEWCTADIDTARTQLEAGDFYVYYSIDDKGNPIVPRLAIRMEGARIAEPPRGIAPNQNLDPYISDILAKKLEEFGSEGEAFKKRTADMKMLTEIGKKVQGKQILGAEELRFLYEIDSSIEGFGYEKDPRIEELRSQRNPEEDMPIVFGCENSQIARNPRDIRLDTKAYVGHLEPRIFDAILKSGIEHVYTKFPEGKIRIEDLEIERKTKAELKQKLDGNDVKWRKRDGSYAESMIDNPDFPSEINKQSLTLVTLKVSDLGFDKGTPTTDQIYDKAKELGLELCPPEVGPEYRISYNNQPVDKWCYIAMKQIADSRGDPRVFRLVRDGDGLWLVDDWAEPGLRWGLDVQFGFSLRKSEPQNTRTLGLLDRLFKR